MDFIKIVNEAFATGKSHPSFRSGDTITVDYRISEGGKERIQRYRGVVIRISGHGEKKHFTVRKLYYLRALTGKKARIKERRVAIEK